MGLLFSRLTLSMQMCSGDVGGHAEEQPLREEGGQGEPEPVHECSDDGQGAGEHVDLQPVWLCPDMHGPGLLPWGQVSQAS